jgi:hypothetical protein
VTQLRRDGTSRRSGRSGWRGGKYMSTIAITPRTHGSRVPHSGDRSKHSGGEGLSGGARVKVVGETDYFWVASKDVGRLPRRVFWSHDERGWAVGPDGSSLGLWSGDEIKARRMGAGGGFGAERRFAISDLTYVERQGSAGRHSNRSVRRAA